MDPGYRSPLVELFMRGDAPRDVRMMAARGLLPRPAHEQIALLAVLYDDSDPEISRTATATIERLPREAVDEFLTTDVPAELRAFFAGRAQPASPAPLGLDLPIAGEAATPVTPATDGTGQTASETREAAAGPEIGEESVDEELDDEEAGADPRLVSSLPIAARLKLATKGTREQRAQLIRDSNRIVATAVLGSPKLTESEVEAFAKMGNVSEDVLRIIGTNRSWLKNYGIIHAVTRNPKTPPAISMQLMHRLTEKDIKMLTTDRNVPESLRLAARRVITKAANK
jgi:hypothetical protein